MSGTAVNGLPAARWRGLLPARRVWVAAAAVCLFPVVLAVPGFTALLAEDIGPVSAAVPAVGGDALWLGHAWVDGRRTDSDLTALAARLRETGIRDLFAHVGPLSDNGSLDPALRPRARWLLTGLHHQVPGVRVQAWLGDLVGPGHLDLADPAARALVAGAAAQVLTEGFDGIHYDLEPLPSGDGGYLALLAVSHTLTRSRHKTLSVAGDQIEPLPYLHTPEQWIFGSPHWWSAGYLRAVAARADEVALMTYNTGAPDGPAYSGYVRLETRIALAAVPPTGPPISATGRDGCESYAASHGLRLELAHVRRARAGYQLMQGQHEAARHLLDAALPVFRQAGDFRCIARTLFELAQPSMTSDPAAVADLLLECLRAAAIASGPVMTERVLTGLISAAASAGDMVLAARCAGALEALGEEREISGPAVMSPAEPALTAELRRPAYATFIGEGRAGGIDLITALYPRQGCTGPVTRR